MLFYIIFYRGTNNLTTLENTTNVHLLIFYYFIENEVFYFEELNIYYKINISKFIF